MSGPVLFLDVAGTLLGKLGLERSLHELLDRFGHDVPLTEIVRVHKLVSETVEFPSRTTKEFYAEFNRRLLNALGIAADAELVEAVYDACRSIAWAAYEDVSSLREFRGTLVIVSNWDCTLAETLARHLPLPVDLVCGSADLGVAKPDPEIFRRALASLGAGPERVVHVGDSIRSDYEAARAVGIRSVLLDRHDLWPRFHGERVLSLAHLPERLFHPTDWGQAA